MTGPGCPSPLHAKPCRVHSLCLCYPSLALGWEFASSPLVTRCSLQPLGGDLEKPLTNFHTPWHTELALPKLSHTWRSQGWLLGGPTEQSLCAPLIPLPSPDLKEDQLTSSLALPPKSSPLCCGHLGFGTFPFYMREIRFPNLSRAGQKERTGKDFICPEECEWGLLVRGRSWHL